MRYEQLCCAYCSKQHHRKHGVGKLVLAGTPSTRFDGNDIDGLSEDQLKYPKKFLQLYAESKAQGEQVSVFCSSSTRILDKA
jgi:nucleoside-diphosphate-sugar epimerase